MRQPAYKIESNNRDKRKLAPDEAQAGRATAHASNSQMRSI
jgi:hypothetical protein